MNIKRLRLGFGLTVLATCALSAEPTAETAPKSPEPRVWTAQGGQSVTADFVELNQGNVVLKGTNGAPIKIRLSVLSPADQAFVQELQTRLQAGPAAETVGAKTGLLPVFLEGAGKGFHAVYSNENFVATVLDSGQVTVCCLEGTNQVGKTITLFAAYGYNNVARNRYVNRKIVSYEKAPRPTLTPTGLSYEGTLDDGVKFGLSYEFRKNTVQAWGWVEDPAGISYPTGYHLRFRFDATHEFEPQTPVAERKKAVAGYAVLIAPVDGKPTRYPYGDKVKRFEAPAKRLDVEGPVFGRRKVFITAPSLREGTLGPWIYSDFCPYEGYAVGLQKDDKALRSDTCRMILTVD